MRFGQVKEYNKKNDFFQKHAENEIGKLVLDLFMRDKNKWPTA